MTSPSTTAHVEVLASRRQQLRLTSGLLRRAQHRGLETLLIVSAEAGAGRTTLLDVLATYATTVSSTKVHLIRSPDLAGPCPLLAKGTRRGATALQDREAGRAGDTGRAGKRVHNSESVGPYELTIIDGPAVMEGAAALALSPDWVAAIDGAIIVVNARKTQRGALKATAEWLDDMGVPPVGVVWNELGLPPVSARLYERRQRQADLLPTWIPNWLGRALRGRARAEGV